MYGFGMFLLNQINKHLIQVIKPGGMDISVPPFYKFLKLI